MPLPHRSSCTVDLETLTEHAQPDGFGTFGAPHIKSLVAEVATRALKAVWFQKWFVHRMSLAGGVWRPRPQHAERRAHRSAALGHSQFKSRSGSFQQKRDVADAPCVPQGCPQHPLYAQGHGTVAGACVTILKAFFDETFVIPDPVTPSTDGLSLLPYTGADADQLTVGGELNKIAANIALGRTHAAVHWRFDYEASLPLGEAIAISVLRDQRPGYNENFQGFTFTKFDGTRITV